MKQMIPLEKQSKKARKAFYAQQRGSWYGVNPVTRRAANPKAYDRNQFKRADARRTDTDPIPHPYRFSKDEGFSIYLGQILS